MQGASGSLARAPMQVTGSCQVLYCLDIARAIDIGAAEERLSGWRRASFHHKSRVLTGDAVLPPLRVSFDAAPPASGKWAADPEVELALYDLGALCVIWRIPFDSPLEELVELSTYLYDNEPLKSRSRALARDVLASLGSTADRPEISDLVEDYVVFEVEAHSGHLEELTTSGALARVLRAEQDDLAREEIENSLSDRVGYRANEACFIDWLAAFLVGADSEDERLVLELATVELLELRLLDSQLDKELNEAYGMLGRPRRPFGGLSVQRRELERVGRMQADGAVLHEGLDNALKLLGDDYLARVYRAAADRFHFNDWDASVERKLRFLRNVYESLSDLTTHRRSEILEWIIIVLIAVDIALYFTPFR